MSNAQSTLTRLLSVAVFAMTLLIGPFVAAQAPAPAKEIEQRVQTLIPTLEKYVASGMRDFDVPGAAIGIVVGDKLVYAKGFGIRAKNNQAPVDSRTVFQVGSTTKAFLAATIAIAVDRGKLRWDDRVTDLDADFQLKDPWVTREFRVLDLLAQRSGLPPSVNDVLGFLYGFDEAAMIRSLRYVEPVSSFRSTFAYTNVTHMLAGRIVAKTAGAAHWHDVLQKDLLDPLGMKSSSYSAAAINNAANHAQGHLYRPEGSVQVPIYQIFPYEFAGAGAINSTIEDMSRWVRMQLGDGSFEGRRIVSAENLALTRAAKVAITDKLAYAFGWVVAQTPNGAVVWHNGGTTAFGAYVGLQSDRKLGVIVLTNETNVGFPDALGMWTMDRLLDNPPLDHVAEKLKSARAGVAAQRQAFARPANPRAAPPLGQFAGNFSNPSFGQAVLSVQGDALILSLKSTGAQSKLEPWDGDVFTIRQLPNGRFADVVKNMGDEPNGFGQFQMDGEGKPNLLKLSFTENGQTYEFRREQGAANAKPVAGH